MTVNPARIGVIFGLFLALMHSAWAALVAVGWAQPVMDFVFWAHFIAPPYHVETFELGRAAILIVLALITGILLGAVGGTVWNLVADRRREE